MCRAARPFYAAADSILQLQNGVCRLKRFKLQLDRASAFSALRKLSGSAECRAACPFYAAARSITAAKRSCRPKRFKPQLDRASAFPEIRKLSGSAKHRAARPFYAATACSIAAAKRSLQAEAVQTAIGQDERIFCAQKIERLCGVQGRSSILRRHSLQYRGRKTEFAG